jgi:hypothetical protein
VEVGHAVQCQGNNWLSTVRKKDPTKQRKLLMQVANNYIWCDATQRCNHGLFGGGALTRVHAPSDSWSFSAFDEDSAFTRVLRPDWMHPWVAAPPILAQLVWHILPSTLQQSITKPAYVAPQYMRLTMGSSHSAHILMAINMHTVGKALHESGKLAERFINDNGQVDLQDDGIDKERTMHYGCSDAEWIRSHNGRQQHDRHEAGYTVQEWVSAERTARNSGERHFVVMNLFSRERRYEDIQYWCELIATQCGLKWLMICADLATNSDWDLGKSETYNQLMKLANEGLCRCLDWWTNMFHYVQSQT